MNPTEDNQPDTTTPIAARRSWWLRLLGIKRRQGRWIKFRPTVWGWMLIGLIIFVGGGAAFTEYSMQPNFCRSCHVMEPYYQAWHESSHKDIPCGDCHFEPGWRNTIKGKWQATSQAVKFITGTYGSKPHAEVRDASCLRSGCHERRLLEGDVAWPVPTQRGQEVTIRFDHTPHLETLRRGKTLRCVSCHSQMVQGQHIVVTLDTCFLCHFKGLKHGRDDETLGGCGSCHDAPKEEIRLPTGLFDHADYLERGVLCENCHSDSVSGDGAVPRQLCWNCHNKPHHLARYGDTQFIHQTHVTSHKVECASCHIQIVHHLTAAAPSTTGVAPGHMLDNKGACGQCHEQTHMGPADLYRGTGGRGVPEMPSPMYRAQVDCIACHQTLNKPGEVAAVVGQTFVASQARCDHCHGNRYDELLAEWNQIIAEHLGRAETACVEADAKLRAAKLTGDKHLQARRLFDDASHNLRLVQLGRGVHNVTYATALLNVTIDYCRQIDQVIAEDEKADES